MLPICPNAIKVTSLSIESFLEFLGYPASAEIIGCNQLKKRRNMNKQHNVGVADRIGTYSDAIEVPAGARWLITAGTPGLDGDGQLPSDFATQATQAWENVLRMLNKADMGVENIVKITQVLTRKEDIDAYRPIRSRYLGDARPASMLTIVDQFVWPNILIELEVVAAKS
jgi:enamine deaminase RidA (YjgF/YER057c/UK114 family)